MRHSFSPVVGGMDDGREFSEAGAAPQPLSARAAGSIGDGGTGLPDNKASGGTAEAALARPLQAAEQEPKVDGGGVISGELARAPSETAFDRVADSAATAGVATSM